MKISILSLLLSVLFTVTGNAQDTSPDSVVIYLDVTLSDGKTIQLYTGDSIVNSPPAVAITVKCKSLTGASGPKIKSCNLIIVDNHDIYNEPIIIKAISGSFSEYQLVRYNRLDNKPRQGNLWDQVRIQNCVFEDGIRRRYARVYISGLRFIEPARQEVRTTFTRRGIKIFTASDSTQHIHKGETFKCFFKTNEGRLDGAYSSYYLNGVKKSEGTFRGNYRIGVWSVWDSTGALQMQRNYSNPFTFKTLFPTDTPSRFNTTTPYTLRRTETGTYEYFYVTERMVVLQRRLWRDLTPEYNPILFRNNLLFNLMVNAANSQMVNAYQDQVFAKSFTQQIDTAMYSLVAFRVKEDWFFDNQRLQAETRQIGLCPIVVDKNTSDTIELCWFYYPTLRESFADKMITDVSLPKTIKNLDDIFFFHYYFGQIYKESNIFDREIREYTPDVNVPKEAERIELGLIEMEHDQWMRYVR